MSHIKLTHLYMEILEITLADDLVSASGYCAKGVTCMVELIKYCQ